MTPSPSSRHPIPARLNPQSKLYAAPHSSTATEASSPCRRPHALEMQSSRTVADALTEQDDIIEVDCNPVVRHQR